MQGASDDHHVSADTLVNRYLASQDAHIAVHRSQQLHGAPRGKNVTVYGARYRECACRGHNVSLGLRSDGHRTTRNIQISRRCLITGRRGVFADDEPRRSYGRRS